MKIPASSSLELKDEFTLSFYIYLLDDYGRTFRNIISRGDYSSQTPSIYLYPNSNKLSVRVSTNSSESQGFNSNCYIPVKRWTHLLISGFKRSLKLYVNVGLKYYMIVIILL